MTATGTPNLHYAWRYAYGNYFSLIFLNTKKNNHIRYLVQPYVVIYCLYARNILNPTILSPRNVFITRSPFDTLDLIGISETCIES